MEDQNGKKRSGRKPVPDEKRRKHPLVTSLTLEELVRYTEHVQGTGLTMSEWLRQAMKRALDREEEATLTRIAGTPISSSGPCAPSE